MDFNLHVIHTKEVAHLVPPLDLDGRTLPQWFAKATAGKLKLNVEKHSSSLASKNCKAPQLQRILREFVNNPEAPAKDIGLVFCCNWGPAPQGQRVTGVMFDFDPNSMVPGGFTSEGMPREGCAVFLAAFTPYANDEKVFTAIHELGHVFNLGHDPDQRSFMADHNWHYWEFRSHQADHLRKACEGVDGYREHLPGMSNYTGDSAFRRGGEWRKAARADKLKLVASLAKDHYLIGETIALDLSLSARKKRSRVKVPQQLDPGYHTMRIWYETPEGERLLYRSPLVFDWGKSEEIEVTQSLPMENNPRITVGADGLTFRLPGTYSVWAEFDLSGGRGRDVVKSEPVEFELCLPRTDEDAEVCALLSDPVVGLFVAQKGGVLPGARRQKLRALLKRYPSHGALRMVRYAFGWWHCQANRYARARDCIARLRLPPGSLAQGLTRLRKELGRKRK